MKAEDNAPTKWNSEFERGLLWCKNEISMGVPEDQIQAYLDCGDEFDKGAAAYFCGMDILIA